MKSKRDPVGARVREHVGGQLPLRAEPQPVGQPRDQGRHRVGDLLAGDPLPGADQRVPGALPHIGQVHRVDPVGDAPGAAHVLALDARRGGAVLFLPGLVQRPGPHPARPPVPPRGPVQPGHREPAHDAHRRPGCPSWHDSAAAASCPASRPRRTGRCSTRCAPAGRSSPPPRTCPPAATPASARSTAAATPGPVPVPPAPCGAYPDGSSRLRFSCQHKQGNRQAAAPLCPLRNPQVRPPSAASGTRGDRDPRERDLERLTLRRRRCGGCGRRSGWPRLG